MSRYTRRPVARHWVEDDRFGDEAPMIAHLSVSDHEAVDTGLLWADGSRVMRSPNPIGFCAEIDHD